MLLKLIILTLFIIVVDTLALNYSRIWKNSAESFEEDNSNLVNDFTPVTHRVDKSMSCTLDGKR